MGDQVIYLEKFVERELISGAERLRMTLMSGMSKDLKYYLQNTCRIRAYARRIE